MSRSFNGTTDFLEATGITTLPQASPYTISMWVKPSAFAHNGAPLGYSVGSDYYCFIVTTTPKGVFERSRTSSSDSTGGTPTVSAWNHLAVVVAASNSAIVYVNGTAGTTDATTQALTGLTQFDIGKVVIGGTSLDFFAGGIGEIAVWNTALTATQIGNLHNGGSGGNGVNPTTLASANLIDYWRINPGNQSPEPPLSGFGAFSLTVTGTTSQTTDNPPVDAPGGGGGSVTGSDTSSTSDSTANHDTYARSTGDTSATSDSGTAGHVFTKTSSDTSSTSASAGRSAQNLARAATDTSLTSDSAHGPTPSPTFDGVLATRSATPSALMPTVLPPSGGGSATATDSSSTSDAAGRVVTHPRAVTDTSSTSDTANRAATHPRTAADTSATSDTATRTDPKSRPVSDTSTTSDSATRTSGPARAASDTTSTSDQTRTGISLHFTTSDTSLTSDTSGGPVPRPPSICYPTSAVVTGRDSSATVMTFETSTQVASSWTATTQPWTDTSATSTRSSTSATASTSQTSASVPGFETSTEIPDRRTSSTIKVCGIGP